MPPAPQEVTQLLLAWHGGDQAALHQLMPIVYDELHRLARQYLRREGGAPSLQTTVLVHEAYLRLVDVQQVEWQGRAHFLAIAARLIRQILVDLARQRGSQKRGGGGRHVSLDESEIGGDRPDEDLAALDEALQTLAEVDPRKEPGCRVAVLWRIDGKGDRRGAPGFARDGEARLAIRQGVAAKPIE
jgi:RNA polymerase sigma factor (TIGR02999 family)